MDNLPSLLPPIAPPPAPKPPPKPAASDLFVRAQQEYDDHRVRMTQYWEMNAWLAGDNYGHFERDTEAIDTGEVEVVRLSDLTDEHNAIVAFHAGMDATLDLAARDPNDRDEAQALEDFLSLVHDEWRDQHLAEGGMPLDRVLPDWASRYGVLATYVALDPSNESTGLYLKTVSGVRVYPVFEGAKGLDHVFLIYDARPDQVIGAHENPNDRKEPVRKAVEQLVDPDNRTDCHVVEYYDAHWGVVMIDETIVKAWEHGYGVCPWIVTPLGFGADPNDRSPIYSYPIAREDLRRGYVHGSNRELDLARAYQPFLWRRIVPHAQEEALAGRLFTLLRRLTSSTPPVVVKQGVMSATEGDPEVDASEGAVTTLRDDDALDAFPLGLGQDISGPLLALFAQNRQTGMAPGLLLGAQNPASQMSGTALELGRQGGFEKWSAITTGLEAHYAAVFRRCLDLVAVHGDGLGVAGGYGRLLVPRRAPNAKSGLGAMHEITADLVRRTAVRVKVTLARFNPISLSQTGNGVTIWRSQNLMSKDTAIRIGGFTNDVEGELARIDDDQLADVPEVKQATTLDRLATMAERAAAAGDTKTARELLLQGHYVASRMQMQFQQMMQMIGQGQPADAAAPPAPQPHPAQVPAGVAPNPPPPQAPEIQGQGQSMPQYGIQTGQQGGRPPEGGANG